MNKILFHFLLLLISSFILFSSCSSEDEDIYPKVLKKDGISSISNIRLFTDGKEIVDTNIITNFVRDEEYNPFEKSMMEYVANDILFLSKDTVVFDIDLYQTRDSINWMDKYQFLYSVKKDNKRILFISYFRTFLRGDEQQISRQMLKNVYEVESSFWGLTSRDVIVGYGSYNNLEVSYLAYKISENSLYSSQFRRQRGIIKNEFDPKVLPLLGPRDTLAVEEFKYRYKAE